MAGRRRFLIIAAFCIVASVFTSFGLHIKRIFWPEDRTITLYDGHTDSLHFKNAVACFVIKNGYGYETKRITQTTYVMQTAMPKNRIDVNLELRRQECLNWFNDQIRAGTIISLGATLEGSSLFFVVPKWVAEKYGIETVFDMREHWQIFKDPDSPSKGIFYNGPIGSGPDKINIVKLRAYGLSAHYNVVSPPSAAALEAILAKYQERQQPVFGFCWAPNAVMGAHKWHILKEPAYSAECWSAVMEAIESEPFATIDRACAYKTTATEKIIASGLMKKAPHVVEMLKKMKVDQDTMNEIFAWMRRYNIKDWTVPALYFLREHETEWRVWVTPEAYQGVTNALARAPGAAVHAAGVQAK